MATQSPDKSTVDAELAALPGSSIHELRARWRELFRSDPPSAFGPDLLRRSIAYRLQEDAFGKMSPTVQRELNQLAASLAKNPAARIEPARRIKAGAVLVRDWKGTSHRVTVLDNGFSYQDSTYTSLSEIAREITGTRWNGPRFFGLRTGDKLRDEKSTDGAPRRRGRPRMISGVGAPAAITEVHNAL